MEHPDAPSKPPRPAVLLRRAQALATLFVNDLYFPAIADLARLARALKDRIIGELEPLEALVRDYLLARARAIIHHAGALLTWEAHSREPPLFSRGHGGYRGLGDPVFQAPLETEKNDPDAPAEPREARPARTPSSLRGPEEPWELMDRVEALLGVLADPERAARRLARRLERNPDAAGAATSDLIMKRAERVWRACKKRARKQLKNRGREAMAAAFDTS